MARRPSSSRSSNSTSRPSQTPSNTQSVRRSSRQTNVHPLAYNAKHHPSDNTLRPSSARVLRHAVGEFSQEKDQETESDSSEAAEMVDLGSESQEGKQPRKRSDHIKRRSANDDSDDGSATVKRPKWPDSGAKTIADGCTHLSKAINLLRPHADGLVRLLTIIDKIDIKKLQSGLDIVKALDMAKLQDTSQVITAIGEFLIPNEPILEQESSLDAAIPPEVHHGSQPLLDFGQDNDSALRFSGVEEIRDSVDLDGTTSNEL